MAMTKCELLVCEDCGYMQSPVIPHRQLVSECKRCGGTMTTHNCNYWF